MSSAVRVTVGVPTFNRSGMLREAIESVLAQTFTSFRLIVSDNASQDDTPEVVRSYDDERIHYVRSAENIGPSGNFRRLLELAETEFLVILPDDDILYPDHLAAAVEVLDRLPNVGLVHTSFDLIDERSRLTGTMSPLEARSPMSIERRDLALERLMVSDFPIGFSSVVYRTSAICDAGGLRPEEGPFGDLQLWMRIALSWDFAYVARPLAAFRIHEGTTTQSIGAENGVTSDRRELVLLHTQMRLERRMDFLDTAPLQPARARRLRALAALHDLAERSYWGLPSSEVAARQADIARMYPGILRTAAFWRLVAAQCGGRRARAALESAMARHAR
jgi:hypothetical protein